MSDPIHAKVAKILNSREVAITAGSEQGVRVGMVFNILDPKGEEIKDPDTGEVLGLLERPKVRVKVTQVKDKISVASTYRTVEVNVGGIGYDYDWWVTRDVSAIGTISGALLPPKWVAKRETLYTHERTWEDLDEHKHFVKTGDPVLQALDDIAISEIE